MKFLITGSHGYLGKYLREAFALCGISFLPARREDFDLLDIDSIRKYFSKHDITHVVHLAASVGGNEAEQLYKSNIVGLYNLLVVCSEYSVKHFSYASGNVVYGGDNGNICSEKDKLRPNPNDWYAVSKYAGEMISREFCNAYGILCAIIRIGDIYGPNQKTGNLIKAVVVSVTTKQPLKLYGKGVRTRDYIYVTDAAQGLMFLAKNEYDGTVNLATGMGTSVKEVIEIAREISNYECEIEYVSVEKEDESHIVLDVSKLSELGFVCKISLKEGLKQCVKELTCGE